MVYIVFYIRISLAAQYCPLIHPLRASSRRLRASSVVGEEVVWEWSTHKIPGSELYQLSVGSPKTPEPPLFANRAIKEESWCSKMLRSFKPNGKRSSEQNAELEIYLMGNSISLYRQFPYKIDMSPQQSDSLFKWAVFATSDFQQQIWAILWQIQQISTQENTVHEFCFSRAVSSTSDIIKLMATGFLGHWSLVLQYTFPLSSEWIL